MISAMLCGDGCEEEAEEISGGYGGEGAFAEGAGDDSAYAKCAGEEEREDREA